MHKKNVETKEFIERNINNFSCLICGEKINSVSVDHFECNNNHSFNISKKGSLYLLKNSVKSEYGSEMLLERNNLINHGFFDKVIEFIVSLKLGQFVIDAGSGEGSITKKIGELSSSDIVGIDISKEGTEIAVSGKIEDNQPLFITGDLAKLPFSNQSVDTIINYLSPANYSEFDRVLKSDGQLIKVIPEENYLIELRHHIFEENTQNYNYDNKLILNHFMETYKDVNTKRITYKFKLNDDLRKSLFVMTPLTWMADSSAIPELDEITVDLLVMWTK